MLHVPRSDISSSFSNQSQKLHFPSDYGVFQVSLRPWFLRDSPEGPSLREGSSWPPYLVYTAWLRTVASFVSKLHHQLRHNLDFFCSPAFHCLLTLCPFCYRPPSSSLRRQSNNVLNAIRGVGFPSPLFTLDCRADLLQQFRRTFPTLVSICFYCSPCLVLMASLTSFVFLFLPVS